VPWELQRLIHAPLITASLAASRVFRNRVDTSLEVLALRQQVVVLKPKRPSTPPARYGFSP
jgi:hypothetical protein